jgi:phage gp45-like
MNQVINELKRKILLSVGIGILRIIDDTKKIQKCQISLMDNETHSNVDRYQEYGFSSVPLPGAQAVAVSIAGSRDNSIIIATEDGRYRPLNLNAGEVTIYNQFGDKIVIKQNRTIEITAPNVIINGNLQVTGNILDNSGTNTRTVSGMRTQYNGHTHPGGSIPNLQM